MHRRVALIILACMVAVGIAGRGLHGQTAARKKLLFLTHAALYKHSSLAPAATLDLSFLTPEYLAQFDGLMLMTNGNLPLTDLQKRLIVDFVRNGKALVGVHCASLTLYDYPEFGEVLGGYYRRSIIPTNVVGQRMGVLKVEDPSHPATKMMGGSWTVAEEFYQFGTAVWDASRPTEQISQVGRLRIPMAFSRDRVHVLLSLETDKTDLTGLGPEVVKGGDYPQACRARSAKGARSTPRSATATTSGPRIPRSARTSRAGSAGRWDWKTKNSELRTLNAALG